MNNLRKFSNAVKEASEAREKDRKQWEKELGNPVYFEPDPEIKGHGYGYWRHDKGVLKVRKMSNGYSPNSATLILSEEIEKLYSILYKKEIKG